MVVVASVSIGVTLMRGSMGGPQHKTQNKVVKVEASCSNLLEKLCL